MNHNELGIYAIHDKKSQKYDTPYFAISDLFAKRRFLIMMDEEKSPLNKWNEDFELHKLGEVNMDDGTVIHEPGPKIILEGKSVFLKGKDNEE